MKKHTTPPAASPAAEPSESTPFAEFKAIAMPSPSSFERIVLALLGNPHVFDRATGAETVIALAKTVAPGVCDELGHDVDTEGRCTRCRRWPVR